jgi:hypothetical protein
MGKVVKAVAGVALIAAVVVFAPQLMSVLATSSLFGAAGGVATFASLGLAGAVTGALTSMAIAMGAGLVMSALAAAPGGLAHSGTAPMKLNPETFKFDYDGPEPDAAALPSMPVRWWKEVLFWPWVRVPVVKSRGDCMAPEMPRGAWIVLDRTSEIQPGDIFVFELNDRDRGGYMTGAGRWGRWRINGLIKRYCGVDPDSGMIVFQYNNPPGYARTPRKRITYAYRVVSWHSSYWDARRAAALLRRHGAAND